MRYKTSGEGKSGGVRIIYYRVVKKKTILMLFTYFKNEQGSLSPVKLGILKTLVGFIKRCRKISRCRIEYSL